MTYKGNRFSRPAKETLVSWINEKNNRGFDPSQFVFDDPIRISSNGLVDIPFRYTTDETTSVLRVQRVNIGLVPGLGTLAIHCKTTTTEDILAAIYEQYGLYLDADLIDVSVDTALDIGVVLRSTTLNGFAQTGTEIPVLIPPIPDVFNITITMLDTHLIYEGSLKVLVRMSLLDLPDTISRLLDLREFYGQSTELKPYVEVYQPSGLWAIDRVGCLRDYSRVQLRDLESRLYTMGNGGLVDYDLLANLLSKITGTKWVADDRELGFNVMNSKVLYNGLSGEYPGLGPITHSYLLVLELSDLCSNLQGRINIAYRYSTPAHPAAYPGGSNYL